MQNRKYAYFAMLLTVLSQSSVTIILPAFPLLKAQFGVSATSIQMILTVFILGFALSQWVYGVLSDRFGRKPVLLAGLILFIVSCLFGSFTNHYESFITWRFLQGIGCGSVITLSRAILRDVFTGRELSSKMSFLSLGFGIGIGIAPIIGGYLTVHFGWQSTFYVIATLAFITSLILIIGVPESLLQQNRSKLVWRHIWQSNKDILTNRTFLVYLFGGVCAYAVGIAYNTITPFLIQVQLHISPTQYGWLGGLIAATYLLSANMNKSLVLKYGIQPIIKLGVSIISVAGIVLLVFNVFDYFTVTSIMIAAVIATFGTSFVFANTISGALQQFSKNAGAASALFSTLQMLLSAVAAFIFALLPEHMSITLGAIYLVIGISCFSILIVASGKSKTHAK